MKLSSLYFTAKSKGFSPSNPFGYPAYLTEIQTIGIYLILLSWFHNEVRLFIVYYLKPSEAFQPVDNDKPKSNDIGRNVKRNWNRGDNQSTSATHNASDKSEKSKK